MWYRSIRCLLLLTTFGLLAARASGDPPVAREKDAPATWKHADLNAVLPNAADRGPVTILAWEVVEFDGVFAKEERCLVIKRYAAPTAAGRACAVGVVSRLPNGQPPEWVPGTAREYAALPTNEELAGVLKGHGWHAALQPGELVLRIGATPPNVVKYVPRVVDGGVCAAGWKKALDRAAPDLLFPELVLPAPQK